MTDSSRGYSQFFAELKRRHVFNEARPDGSRAATPAAGSHAVVSYLQFLAERSAGSVVVPSVGHSRPQSRGSRAAEHIGRIDQHG